MLPDRVSNPGPLTYESGALPIELRGPDYRRHLGVLEKISNQSGDYSAFSKITEVCVFFFFEIPLFPSQFLKEMKLYRQV